MVVLSYVFPSIILSSFFEPSLSVKVVSQSRSPHECEKHDDPLPVRNLNPFAVLLMEKEVTLIENRKDGPYAIDPRHLACNLSQHKAKSTKSQREGHSILNRSLFAILEKRKGAKICCDLFEFLHVLIILLNQPKSTRNQYYPLQSGSLPKPIFQQQSYCMKQFDKSKICKVRDKIINIEDMKDDTFSELSRSEYSLKDVLNLQEFKELSKEIHLQQRQEEKLIDSFYCPTWKEHQHHFERTENPQSLYESEYRKWKGQQIKKTDNFKSTYESTLALMDKQKQKQEVNRLIKEYSLDNALFSYSQKNDTLSQIKKQYAQSLQNIIKAQPKVEFKYQHQRNNEPINPIQIVQRQRIRERQENKQKLIELQVQKQLLQKIKKIDEKEKQEDLKIKKQRQLKKSCFVELITRPPVKNTQKQSAKKEEKDEENHSSVRHQSYRHKQNKQQQLTSRQSSEKKARYRLNVDQILKMPHRLFLIFYSQNYNQIVRLSTPEDLKRINSYRDQALKRQQAVQKLKKKIAQQGPEMIAKLPSQMKQKLFKILYEGDLQEQVFYQSK